MAVTAEQLREWAVNAAVEQSEVKRRIVASRHYYATFHKCRPARSPVGTPLPPSPVVHTDQVQYRIPITHAAQPRLATGAHPIAERGRHRDSEVSDCGE